MAAAGDTHKLLSQLPPDTAESVLSWLASRGKDVPVHIPVKTIRFARECFQVRCSMALHARLRMGVSPRSVAAPSVACDGYSMLQTAGY